MSRQLNLLRRHRSPGRVAPGIAKGGTLLLDRPPRRRLGVELQPWSRLTVGDFIVRAEHQFGTAPDATALLLAGYQETDRLAESDIRLLCDRLGLPAADFGVDP